MLKIILSLTKTNHLASWDYTDNTQVASALLVDTDSDEGRSVFAKLSNDDRKQALIAFGNPLDGLATGNDIFLLPKPIRSKNVIPVLQQVAEWLINNRQKTAFAAKEVIEPTQKENKSIAAQATNQDTETQPVRCVIDLLPNDQNSALHVVEKANNNLVIIDRWRNRYYVYSPARSNISKLLTKPAREVIAEKLDRKQLSREIGMLIPHELDITLWKTALSMSDGRLFEGLSRREFFQLRRWPDLKRLGNDPLHMKLTALLRRGATIDYITDFLKAPITDVINFINACYALGYLDHQHKPVEPTTSTTKQLSNGKRNLLSRIRNRLGI